MEQSASRAGLRLSPGNGGRTPAPSLRPSESVPRVAPRPASLISGHQRSSASKALPCRGSVYQVSMLQLGLIRVHPSLSASNPAVRFFVAFLPACPLPILAASLSVPAPALTPHSRHHLHAGRTFARYFVAPCLLRTAADSVWPSIRASPKAVSPSLSLTLGFAPASNRAFTVSTWFPMTAR